MRYACVFCSVAAFTLIAGRADEGMWTFDNPPLKRLREKNGFVPTKAWLDHNRFWSGSSPMAISSPWSAISSTTAAPIAVSPSTPPE